MTPDWRFLLEGAHYEAPRRMKARKGQPRPNVPTRVQVLIDRIRQANGLLPVYAQREGEAA